MLSRLSLSPMSHSRSLSVDAVDDGLNPHDQRLGIETMPDLDSNNAGAETTPTVALLAAASPEMPAMPPHRALLLPEVLLATFEQLDGAAPLAAAAGVCRAWFGPAVHLLWRAPAPSALHCVSNAARCGLYGAAIRLLAVYDYAG